MVKVPFQINCEPIKFFFVNGIVKKDKEGFVTFWVPLYQKCLHSTFYPYLNTVRYGNGFLNT